MSLLTLLVLSLSSLSGLEVSSAACESKPPGAPCTVTLSDGDHTGACMGEPLSCMPTPPPPPPVAKQP